MKMLRTCNMERARWGLEFVHGSTRVLQKGWVQQSLLLDYNIIWLWCIPSAMAMAVSAACWHLLRSSVLVCPLWCCQATGTPRIVNIFNRHGSGQTAICKTL